jgi:hypothetical protein
MPRTRGREAELSPLADCPLIKAWFKDELFCGSTALARSLASSSRLKVRPMPTSLRSVLDGADLEDAPVSTALHRQ